VAAGDVSSPQVDATAVATTRTLRVRSDGPGSAGMLAKDMGRTRRECVGTPHLCPSLRTFTTSMRSLVSKVQMREQGVISVPKSASRACDGRHTRMREKVERCLV
jgi:hypothetical protein